MGGRRLFAAVLAVTAVALLAAPAAQASFHLIKVREVYPGSGAEDAYVELQMYAGGQNFVGGHSMTLYDSAGALLLTSTFPPGTVLPKGENQRAVLIGDTGVQAALGVAPDLVDAGLSISATGGAACWNAGGAPADCVSWGDFHGDAALKLATGTGAGAPALPLGIPAATAIRRTISPGCPTLLEESDDSDDSATDFSGVAPAPRDNAIAPTETTCAGAPNTAIDEKPPLHSNSTEAGFTYDAPTATSYECRLDAALFAACPPLGPKTYAGLTDGSHTFQVRGVNASGPDPTPAGYTWFVDTVAPTTSIGTRPPSPGPGNSAAFAYVASETGASFECSLEMAGTAASFSPCPSTGKTYPDATHPGPLADGEWTFEVRATDQATNLGAPQAYTWTVDNSIADTTPPETTILTRPPDPDPTPNAFFGFSSNEAGSSFECSLDGAPFSPCPASGIAYAGLANGPHSFQVRAIDSSGNVDPTPAGDSLGVAVPAPPRPGPVPEPPKPLVPTTAIAGRAAIRTADRTPTVRFRSATPGATFQCGVDRGPFKPCRSPFTTKKLTPGRHAVQVRAVVAGLADPTPARITVTVTRAGG